MYFNSLTDDNDYTQYCIGTACCFCHNLCALDNALFLSENRRFRKETRETMLREQDSKKNKGDIVGKSQFVLKERIPVPQTAKEAANEKR
jgi:hypothetical protein